MSIWGDNDEPKLPKPTKISPRNHIPSKTDSVEEDELSLHDTSNFSSS